MRGVFPYLVEGKTVKRPLAGAHGFDQIKIHVVQPVLQVVLPLPPVVQRGVQLNDLVLGVKIPTFRVGHGQGSVPVPAVVAVVPAPTEKPTRKTR